MAVDATQLSDAQRQACSWNEGPFLLLAGPGSGKTTVLTRRIIRLLEESQGQSFKILALTFTNRAADEMRSRIEDELSDSADRLLIATFHSFSADVLRMAGQNFGLRADFKIYSREEDRAELLNEALQTISAESVDALHRTKLLPLFDRASSLLLTGEALRARIANKEIADHVANAYEAYHAHLIKSNSQDFPALVLNAFRLFEKYPAIANRYRKMFRYWHIDEFQDTTFAQYRLLKAIGGIEFKNIFAVADDDQIIFQWNGASYQRIQEYIKDFGATVLQLPTNYRCPAAIVEMANKLIAKNQLRQPGKSPLISGRKESIEATPREITLLEFSDDNAEAEGIAADVAGRNIPFSESIAVLARTKFLLDLIHKKLGERNIPSRIVQRRNEFQTFEFRWLQCVLLLASKPVDAKIAQGMIGLFNAAFNVAIPAVDVIADANASGGDYLKSWVEKAKVFLSDHRALELAATVQEKLIVTQNFERFVQAVVPILEAGLVTGDATSAAGSFEEDREAWLTLFREIKSGVGSALNLDSFLQELELRSKEPPLKDGEVALMTIHGAKGSEFVHVYVIGLAEDVLPSYQSLQKGESSPEMEEERRNCFVAITRAKQTLTLSRANKYRGWKKGPSRFLREMELIK